MEMNFPEVLYENCLKEMNGVKFTPREIDIMAFLLNGQSGKRIAAFLSISPKTVENHAHNINIMEKIGCNSREGVIDFVEKSGKFLFLKQYYLRWFIHSEFDRILKNLASSTKPRTCSLVHWSSGEVDYGFLPYLKAHLKLAGIKVKSEGRHKQQSFVTLLSEPSKDLYRIYWLPRAILEEAQDFQGQSVHDKASSSKLLIFPKRDAPQDLSLELTTCDTLDLSQCTNYYSLVFEILKRLFVKHPLEKMERDFQQKISALNFSSPNEQALNSDHKSPSKHKRGARVASRKGGENKRRYFITLFLCFGIVSFGVYYFSPRKPLNPFRTSNQMPQLEEGKEFARSDLIVPPDSVLLERSTLLGQIKAQFRKHPENIQVVVLTGMGGSGKTTLARQYARSQKVSIAWEIDAETPNSLLTSFETFAQALSQTEEDKRVVRGLREVKNPEDRTQKLLQFLENKLKVAPSWILIYDNADSVTRIWKYFPRVTEGLKRGKIIVTSRDSTIQLGKRIPIKELNEEEKEDLFSKIMANEVPHPLTGPQKEETKNFLKNLPPFPLDIATAAYYLKVTHTSYAHYLEHFQSPSEDFNQVQKEILGEASDYTKSRYQILTMPLKRLLDTHKGFDKLLLFISLLDASHIPRDLLEELTDDIRIDQLVLNLKKYSLISSEKLPTIPKFTTYSLHRSTQAIWLAYLLKVLTPGVFQELLQTFLRYTERAIEAEDFERMKVLIPHAEALISHTDLLKMKGNSNLRLALGCLYFYLGKYPEAKHLFMQNLAHPDKVKDIWHWRALTYLGAVHISLGDQEAAKTLLHDSVKGYQENFPKLYAGQAQALRYLATAYRDLGDYKTAKGFFEKSLSIYQAYLSQNHVGVARALGYVGDIDRQLGDFEGARDFLEQSYALYKAHFPDNKLGIVWNLAHLGEVYGILGEFDKAKNILEESLQICKDYLPESHAYYPWISGCLGTAYRKVGRLTEAKEYLTYSASLFQKNFKGNSVYYAWALWHLGVVYGELKEFEQAKTRIQESLDYLEKEYGKDHIEIGNVLQALARVYFLEGNLDRAKESIDQSIKILANYRHAFLYMSLETLADIYRAKALEAQKQGNTEEFQKNREKAKEILNDALNAVKVHFRETSPFTAKLEEKIRTLN